MAKGKNLNPADAYRKAERKKVLKKNKTERQKARDLALVKKDTTSIEEDIVRLEKAEKDDVISVAHKAQLESLRSELERINKKKEEYVAEHPEHKKLVYRSHYRKAEETSVKEDDLRKKDRKVFDKNGLPRHPERSIYYDPVMNPYGVPPPGVPYMERPLRPDEVDSQAEESSEEDESDDDIALPDGPPPGAKNEGASDPEDTDDDIPMPEGPPPPKAPPLPPGSPPPVIITPNYYPTVVPPMVYPTFVPPPPPPLAFSAAQNTVATPPMSHPFPLLPPPGFASTSSGQVHSPFNDSIQNPVAGITPSVYKPLQLTHPLPPKPGTLLSSSPSTGASTISAPAQLRDLKKESTAFVPSSLKRKKPDGGSTSKRVDAAPETTRNSTEFVEDVVSSRPDLLGTLASNFPGTTRKAEVAENLVSKQKVDVTNTKKANADYEKFMQEIGDIL